MDRGTFFREVAEALCECQLVGQELKLCIADKMPLKLHGRDFEDSSLERLIEMFKKLSDNIESAAALRSFKDERNFPSHQGIAHCLDHEGDLFLSLAEEFRNRLFAIQQDAQRLCREIDEEADKFRPHLWFDPI